jgi:hypothetical protein
MGGGYIEKCCWYQWDDDPAAADKSAVHMCQQCQHYGSGGVTCEDPTPGFRIAQPPNVFTSGNNLPPSAGKIGNSTNTVTSSNNNTAVLPAGGIINVPPRTTNALHTGANAGNATNTGNNAGTLPVLTKEHNTSTPKLSSVENPTNQQTSGHHHHKGEQNGGGTSSTGNTQSGSTNNNPSSGGNNNGKSDNSNGKK